ERPDQLCALGLQNTLISLELRKGVGSSPLRCYDEKPVTSRLLSYRAPVVLQPLRRLRREQLPTRFHRRCESLLELAANSRLSSGGSCCPVRAPIRIAVVLMRRRRCKSGIEDSLGQLPVCE